MSEADNSALSILLPSASVGVFSNDKATLEAAASTLHDWRFARVKVQAREGDARTAAQIYKETPSPDLVIVQTEEINDDFIASLEELASNCQEGTAAIVIGPVNDVYLYRKLIDMGVSDYLVRPLEAPVMANVIAKTLIDRLGVTGSRLIAFIGAKGGVGTSVLAQSTAWGLSDVFQQKGVLLDASGGWSVASVSMGFEPSTTLLEAARAAEEQDEDSLKRMLFAADERLSVLASGGDVMLDPTITPDQMETLLGVLMVKYPVIIADLSKASPDIAKSVINKAHQIVVVSTPTVSSLRLARSLIQEIKELTGDDSSKIEMIINMQGISPKNEVRKSDIEAALEFEISTAISYMPEVFLAAEAEGKKLSDNPAGKDMVHINLMPVVQKILSVGPSNYEAVKPANDGFIGGILNKLKAK